MQRSSASITHIVLIIQENRSFDNLFATFPKANGATHGTMHTGQVIALTKAPLVSREHQPQLRHLSDRLRPATGRHVQDGRFRPVGTSTGMSQSRQVSLSLRRPIPDHAVLDPRATVRARRQLFSDARQRQFHRAPGSHRRRYRHQLNRESDRRSVEVHPGDATRRRAR